jgi:hypothetical protein
VEAAIGVGAAVSPLLAKEILDGDGTLAGVAFAFAFLTFDADACRQPTGRNGVASGAAKRLSGGA